ncbi:glycosyltransferase family 2 protein [Ramlibacter sp.]|uniref:glycosyltransferase family 2 protein n=1 Tax=Ramlibacter sp. TaxID=1917967 RepID=UPI003D0C088A
MTSFSIFLPVRNGWPYVQDCVASILAQTHADFELTILDNQSTDETGPWLKTLTDPRIRLQSSTSSLSIVESWARILHAPKREYMTLIGHDDLLGPGFLAAVDALIRAHPDAGLYQTGGRMIDSEGRTLRACSVPPEREDAAGYLRARLDFDRDVFGTGFVMRSRDYERVGGIPPFEKLFFADDALWLSLMRGSYKAGDPADHFAIRLHLASESASLPSVWGVILRSLAQFQAFLQSYVPGDARAAEVVRELGPSFLLGYHRNAYIYALVEASVAGRPISEATRNQIESSLAAHTGFDGSRIRASARVRAVEFLNGSPLRATVPWLWTLYNRIKNRPK